MKNVLRESYEELDRMMAFTAGVESELNECLKNGTIPDAELVEKIAVCKIKCIEVAVERVHQLRLEVGSYALMHDTGFELVDMLLCCKFAEGDSRILQQKLARDRLRKLQRSGVSGEIGDMFVGRAFSESVNALKLAQKLAPAGRDIKKLGELMDEHWSDIYELADQICERHINDSPGGQFLEPCVARLRGANFDFDSEWKDKI